METAKVLEYAEKMLDIGIIGILGIMSIVALWLFVERLMFYKSVRYEDYKNKDILELDLGDNLSTISAIASNAPYVGLIGTILGIMITFYSLGDGSGVDTKKIMTGLALALKATAAGILVAIPAITFYTILLRKMERILTYYGVETSENAK